MLQKLVAAAVAVCAFALASDAFAGELPAKDLVKKANAICAADSATVAHLKAPPDSFLFTFKDKQLKAYAPYFDKVSSVAKAEYVKLFALGTPSEAAAKTRWSRWKTLVQTREIPLIDAVKAAADKGSIAAMKKAFTGGDKQDAEFEKLVQALGLKSCAN
jgi:hypothetical protein